MEENCEEFQKIMVKRKIDKLARLEENLNSLKDGSEKLIEICKSLKAKINEEIGDRLMQDVIEGFLEDIESGKLLEQEAFKNLCEGANKTMKHAIANVTTTANKEFEKWDNLMANVSNLSESKIFETECQASQSSIREELPDDKYNAWTDPWTYFTGNIAKAAGFIAAGVVGGGLGMFSTFAGETCAPVAYYIRRIRQTANRSLQLRVCSFALPRFQTLARCSVQFSSFLFSRNMIQYKNTYRNCKVGREPRRNQKAYEAWAPQSQRNKQNKMKFAE